MRLLDLSKKLSLPLKTVELGLQYWQEQNFMIKIAVLGYGTVGSGVVEVIQTNGEVINKRIGEELEIKYVLDLREFPGDPYEDKVVHDVNVILEDPEVQVVCETMGGVEPAFTFSKKKSSLSLLFFRFFIRLYWQHPAQIIIPHRNSIPIT